MYIYLIYVGAGLVLSACVGLGLYKAYLVSPASTYTQVSSLHNPTYHARETGLHLTLHDLDDAFGQEEDEHAYIYDNITLTSSDEDSDGGLELVKIVHVNDMSVIPPHLKETHLHELQGRASGSTSISPTGDTGFQTDSESGDEL